ncbi:hypothetical protein [Acidocella aminolytica]|uniref:Uracil-DNA glycosylase n=1 Tax=Acidocella aminolytica 101 = DSM 11237 TaxID=1120923 RepID=A0A0D6PAJ0_9PROT|nr:hypothetical protein [Acidocella aminolytica]GAN78765.1 hypothetical protein Aam_007_052 [Acidocella aminolytica 101 = DSM 11237]GBQ33859.1 hypothetical protein AA11237_0597 [Acidocella aminolytica 101 = DSM 11237]SHE79513.1 hypothetical protein SAMN02746095_01226 [Acidocella aminolytica 101 = DSM 11237]
MNNPPVNRPWVGKRYDEGVSGRKIAICGYSHWSNPDEDMDSEAREFEVERTCRTIETVISGEESFSFFSRIKDYFGFEQHVDFWPRVIFFNFVPSSIGLDEERYKKASSEQEAHGRQRVIDILNEYRPNDLVIFTKKGWNAFPPTLEDATEIYPNQWQTYELSDGTLVRVFPLRHPQFANKLEMTQAIEKIFSFSGQKEG